MANSIDSTSANESRLPQRGETPELAGAPYRPAAGRDVAALLNPRPVVLVGAGDNGNASFATVAWITPVSHNPAMIAFALRATSRTLELAREAGLFSVSVLDARDAASVELATYCGNTSGRFEDKFARVPFTLTEATPACEVADEEAAARSAQVSVRIPVVEGALSWLACAIDDVREVGDHLLVTALVTSAQTRCPEDGRGRISCTQTLLCVQHDAFAGSSTL